MSHDVLDTVLSVAVPGIAAGGTVIGLMIRNAILGSKVEVTESLSETNSLIRSHIAADDQKHIAIEDHFKYTDRRVDNLEAKR